MNFLFIHQNFPGQFRHLAPALAQQGHKVVALTMKTVKPGVWQGVHIVPYSAQRGSAPAIHPWVGDFETKVIRAEACLKAARSLKQSGYVPDVIVAHPGWGESLFVKDVWPKAKLGIYCEFFYNKEGADVGFDPEFASASEPENENARIRLKNLNSLLHFDQADAGIAPTHWQASTFPEPFRSKISVIHDGIDTQHLVPNPAVRMDLTQRDGTTFTLTRQSEVITFVNRNLEPYRGYHTFMRALPQILAQRPNARVLLVGGDSTSYGARPDPTKYGSKTWKDIFAEEARKDMSAEDWKRVHFLGNIAYPHFVQLLQLSSVHVYLTYPFVLSWSLLEAMSVGCAVVASDTAPVREVISDGETGYLVDFFDANALANRVCRLLGDPMEREKLGPNARESVKKKYDLYHSCLPKLTEWVKRF